MKGSMWKTFQTSSNKKQRGIIFSLKFYLLAFMLKCIFDNPSENVKNKYFVLRFKTLLLT